MLLVTTFPAPAARDVDARLRAEPPGWLAGGLEAVLMTTTLTTTIASRPPEIVDLTGDDSTPITLLGLRPAPRADDGGPPSKKRRVGEWSGAPKRPVAAINVGPHSLRAPEYAWRKQLTVIYR